VTDVFLGVIAVAVSVMAIIQVAAIVFAVRAARRVGDAAGRLEQRVQPIVANLQSITSDVARATATAAAGVDRADRAVTGFVTRLNDILAVLRETVTRPARGGMAWLQVFKAAMDAFRAAGERRRRPPADDDEGMFIG
jgi:hypothetical protein